MAKKKQKPKKPHPGKEKKTKSPLEVGETAFPAKIMEITGKMGTREGGQQVRVKILAGPEAGKVMRRNVLGPIKIGDILMLRETEIEASPIKGRKR